ncbi:exodeoxyribonuclease V subunit beta [Limnochorda pilosa]|uniref:UvrD-helicase domain-containing protein n=1 Tax=Limnochorda pilosa TaxID=1555112 RepID=UPI0026ED99C7|nr:UvrD-helicase domain-containing protein [Limnochorda pilosa]
MTDQAAGGLRPGRPEDKPSPQGTDPGALPPPLPDQAARTRIVEDLETCFLVEAGAGSGKTHSLVSRMVSLIASGRAHPSQMAAITFTRKAAAELRERFQIRLEAAAAAETDPVRRARLQAGVAALDQAFLGTIHAFCARLLRERPVEAGLDPAFEELTEDEEERGLRAAWEAYLEEVRQEAPQRLEALRALGVEPQELYGLFTTLHRYADVEPVTADRPRPELAPVREALARFVAEMERLLPATEPPKGWDPLQTRLRRLRQEVQLLPEDDDAALIQVLTHFEARPSVTKNRWPDPDTAEAALAAFQAFAQTVAGPALHAWREFLHRPLIDFVRPAIARAAWQRHEAGQVSFQDLLLKTAQLLRDQPEVRRSLGARYTHLLVDEFQDTDPVQAEVLFLLTGEPVEERDWRQLTPRPGSLFLVGDPKQSIYRFRRADIDVYQQVKELLVRGGGEVLQLTANFRSVQPLIEWVNETFRRSFPERGDGVQPGYAPLVAVRPGRERAPVRVLEVPPVFRHTQDGIAEEDSARVAAWIAWACQGGLELERTPEERARGLDGRPRPGDFLLLHWDRAKLLAYAEALEARGIPAEVTGAKGYAGAWEVAAFLDLLEALADPADPVQLLAVLRGPLFGLSDQALYELGERVGGRWALLLDRSLDELPEPGRAALAQLQHWLRLTEALPPQAALEGILEETGLLPWTAALPAGASRAGNLLKLVEVARSLGGGRSFPRLVQALGEVVRQQELEAGSLFPGRPQAVRVMNLHRAKGLEAPVVILAYPAGAREHPPTFHIRREGEAARGFFPVWGPPASPFGRPQLLALPPDWEAAAAREARYLEAEDLRLLYVAATRARELLVISRYPASPERSPWHRLEVAGALDHAPTVDLPKEGGEAAPVRVRVEPAQIAAACEATQEALARARIPTTIHLAASDLEGRGPAAEGLAAWDGEAVPPGLEEVAAAQEEAEPGGRRWGRAFHRLVELLIREGRLAPWRAAPQEGTSPGRGMDGLPEEALARYVAQEAGLAQEEGPDPAAVLVGWVQPFLASALGRRVAQAQRVEVEVPLALAVPAGELAAVTGGVIGLGGPGAGGDGTPWLPPETAPDTPAVIHGQADLLFREGDGWVLVDFKTDRLPAGKAGPLVARYGPQLRLYATAWERVTGEPVKERWLYLVRAGQAYPVP